MTAYELRLAGHLDDHWAAWLGGQGLVRTADGTTVLAVVVDDQAQLHGVLAAVRDLGAELVSLQQGSPTGMPGRDAGMATTKQVQAAKKNVKKAQAGAKKSRSIASMPKATRTALGKQGAAVAKRKRTGARGPKTRQELYEEAKRKDLPGRSKMGRDELAKALGHS